MFTPNFACSLSSVSFLRIFDRDFWETEMIRDGASPWKCRAGGRYLYVDEFGRVSYCSQRRGEPGKNILDYGQQDLRAAFDAPKGCEDACTIACVRRASSFDGWRPQKGEPPPRRGLPVVA